jgi:hypothetical protein
LMLKCIIGFGGLGLEELGRKLVIMGYDGSNVFQSNWMSVILQLRKKIMPYNKVFLVLATKLALMLSFYQLSLLCINWKIFYKFYILFLLIAQKNLQNFTLWLIFLTPKTICCWGMWKPIGSTCFFQPKKYVEYHLFIMRCMLKIWKLILHSKIWVLFVIWSSF